MQDGGGPIAQQWQQTNGQFPPRKRVHPATPCVLGGTYALNDPRPVDSVELMSFWGDFATQIRELRNGAQVRTAIQKAP